MSIFFRGRGPAAYEAIAFAGIFGICSRVCSPSPFECEGGCAQC